MNTSEIPPAVYNLPTAKEELEAAFTAAYPWYLEKVSHDPLRGFGRGGEWGAHIMAHYMPRWLQEFAKNWNWHPVCLLDGLKGFLFFVESCGLPEDQFWRFAALFHDYHRPKPVTLASHFGYKPEDFARFTEENAHTLP